MDANHRPRGIIKRDRVRSDGPLPGALPSAPSAHPATAAAAPGAHAPRVRLLRLDEHTQAIELTCACGEVSLIEIEGSKK